MWPTLESPLVFNARLRALGWDPGVPTERGAYWILTRDDQAVLVARLIEYDPSTMTGEDILAYYPIPPAPEVPVEPVYGC